MAKNLVIVESPGKVKSIGKFLGRNYKIEASVGHIRDLPKSKLGVEIENDFKPNYISIRGKGDVISNLKKQAQKAEKILLATDPDREGEAISWHLANILNLDEKEKCRVTFNEITRNAVADAIKKPRGIDMKLVDAQQARRVLDRIVGYKISPLLWKKIKKGLSAGRVQSVATRLICDRDLEIKNFKPEEYWSITAKLKRKNDKKVFEAKFYGDEKGKIDIKNEEQANGILDDIKNEIFKVKSVRTGTKKRAPAPPFTTSTLQQEASRKLGYTTVRTMRLAQQLYEGIDVEGEGSVGLVTYIRTDSKRISDEAVKEAAGYIEKKYGKDFRPAKPKIFKNKSASQDAHEAIRPTHMNLEPHLIKGSLNNDQFKLYKLIWDRFVASQMTSAIYDTVSASIIAAGYIFKANGSKLKFPGFMAVYIESTDDEKPEKETEIPILEKDEILDLKSIDPKQHFTQPPPHYTEASLIKELEEKGIGRPSTYSPTINTILARGYVEKVKKTLIATDLGKIVNDLMRQYFDDIVDVEFTAQMENQLDEVEEGKKEWKSVLRDFYPNFKKELSEAEEKMKEVEIPDEESDVVCDKCGKYMVIKQGRFGKFLACPAFPECKNTKAIIEEAGVSCPKCGGKVLIKKTRRGKNYIGCENYPECKFMSWDMASDQKCPECGNFMTVKYVKGFKKYRCSSEKCEFQKEELRSKKKSEV